MIENYDDYVEFQLCRLVSFGLVFSSLNGVARFFAKLLLHNPILGSYFTLIVWCICLAIFLTNHWSEFGTLVLLPILCYVFFVVSMYALFELSREWIFYYLNDLMIYMLVGFPMFSLIKKVQQWDMLLDVSGPIFRITSVLMVITYVLSGGSFFTPMEWGNRVVPIALCFIVYVYYKRDKRDFIILLMLIMVSLLGGRQSFAIIIASLGVAFLCIKSNSLGFLMLKCSCIGTMGIGVLFLEKILLGLIDLLANFGIHARSLDKLASGFLEDSGRTKIYKACRQIIAENGLKLNGMFSDHYYIVKANVGKNYKFAHNFAYELLIDYGIVLGGIFLLWLFFLFVRTFIKCKEEYRCLYIIFCLYGMGRILVSSSIFIYFNFVILIGFLYNDYIFYNKENMDFFEADGI